MAYPNILRRLFGNDGGGPQLRPEIVPWQNAPEFSAPTADAPGKSGLVPQPQATDPAAQIASILTMQGWRSLSPAFVAKDPTSVDSKQLCPAIVFTEALDANTVASGFFQSAKWTNAPSDTSGTLLAFQIQSLQGYVVIQIFFSYTGHSSYRTTIGTIAYGQTPETATWEKWATIGAPKPQAAAGVGQWKAISTLRNTINLPDQYTWAYYLQGLQTVSNGSVVNGLAVGVAAGGTAITITPGNGVIPNAINGFVWRIQ